MHTRSGYGIGGGPTLDLYSLARLLHPMYTDQRVWTEACIKERKHLLAPSYTAKSMQREDLADLRKYNAKLSDCAAMHQWDIQRERKDITGTRRPGQLSQTTSVLAELVSGVPTKQSEFMTPQPEPVRRRVVMSQKPTVHTRMIKTIDPSQLDTQALLKLQALEPFAPIPAAPPLPERGPATLVGQAGRRAAQWNDGALGLSQWELGARGDTAHQTKADAKQRSDETAQETLGKLLKMTEKRGRRRVKPLDEIDGARPRHPLQNPNASLRRGLPATARPPEQCDYTHPYAPAADAAPPVEKWWEWRSD